MKARKTFPGARVRLSGENENVFNLIGLAAKALERAGIPPKEIRAFCEQAINQPSYNAVLAHISQNMEID